MATPTPWSLTGTSPAPFTVNEGLTAGAQSSPVTIWLQGQFAVLWQTGSNGLVVKPYDPVGAPDAGFGTGAREYVLKEASGADVHNAVATATPGLGIVATWEQDVPNSATGATVLKGALVDSTNGAVFHFDLPPLSAGAVSQHQAAIISYEALDGNNKTYEAGFQVAYTETDASGANTVLMQRYIITPAPAPAVPIESQPIPDGPPTLISVGGSNASMTALHDGQLAVAYEEGGDYKVQVFKPSTDFDTGVTSFDPLIDPTGDGTEDFVDVLVGGSFNPGSAKLVSLVTGFMAVYAVGDEIHATSFLGTAGLDGWTPTLERTLSKTGGLAGFQVAPLDQSLGSGVVLTWASGGNILGQVFNPGGIPLGGAQVFGAALNTTGHFSVAGLDSGLLVVASETTANGGDIAAQLFDTRAPDQLLEGARTGGQRETLIGTMGDDTLNGLAREDVLYGSAGIDTALYSGTRSQYTLSAAGGGNVAIVGPDAGSSAAKPETLNGIEYLRFSDGLYKLDSTTAALTLVTAQAPLPGTVSIADPLVQVAEGAAGTTRTFTFNAVRDPGTTGQITVDWAVTLGPAGPGNANAADFKTLSGKVTILAGQTSAPIQVVVNGDDIIEKNEAFTVTLSNPVGATLGTATAKGIIVNDDAPTNHAPVAAVQIANQTSPEDTAWSFTVPAGTFTDIDQDTLTLSATQGNGSALPAWLSFNIATGTFSGTPPANFNGQINLKVTADDGQGGTASETFVLTVTPVNDGPGVLKVTGALAAGETLTAALGPDQDGPVQAGSESWQWFRDGTAIAGATGKTYTLAAGDLGHHFSVTETYTDGSGFAESVMSATTGAVGTVSIVPAAPPGAKPNLDASHTLVDVSGAALGNVTYTWQTSADGVNFANVASRTPFQPAPTSTAGIYVRATANYTDLAGTAEHASSAAVHYIQNENGLSSVLNGVSGVDIIFAMDGADTINAGAGSDSIFGMAGNDTITGSAGDGDDYIDGGVNLDTYDLSTLTTKVSVDLANGFSDSDAGHDTLVSIEIVKSGSGNDILLGSSAQETLNGGAGDDSISGGAGNDSLAGGDGLDTLLGGDGSDTLDGGLGADSLDGGAGADTMIGGAGSDIYVVDNGGDVVRELNTNGTDPGGIDTIQTTLTSFTLAGLGNIENLTFSGASGTAFTGGGNALANTITGLAGNDTLTGGDGADTLFGGVGNDSLIGGNGFDSLVGGAGNDVLTGGTGNDVFVFGPGFGQDLVTDFDANPLNGQDVLDISALGITAADFAAKVSITVSGGNTLVTFADTTDTITLAGVTGLNANVVTQADFILA